MLEKKCKFACPDEKDILQENKYWSERRDFDPFPSQRSPYEQDKQRILLSTAFNRMTYKTQLYVFYETDYRNRLTHTILVDEITSYLATKLGLNVALAQAIALGHDIGHAPFGHAGERTLNSILVNLFTDKTLDVDLKKYKLDSFKHNHHALTIVQFLAKQFFCLHPKHLPPDWTYNGLNLTRATKEGILFHTKVSETILRRDIIYAENVFSDLPNLKKEIDFLEECINLIHVKNDVCGTLEGQLVSEVDEIAQVYHDLQDGLAERLIEPEEILSSEVIKNAIQRLKRDTTQGEEQELINTPMNIFELKLMNPTKAKEQFQIEKSGRFDKVRHWILCTTFKNILTEGLMRFSQKKIHELEKNFKKGVALEEILEVNKSDQRQKRYRLKRKIIGFDPETLAVIQECKKIITERIYKDPKVVAMDIRGKHILLELYKIFKANLELLPEERYQEYKIMNNGGILKERFLPIIHHLQGMTDHYANNLFSKLCGTAIFV